MSKFLYEHGDTIADIITGFEGVVTGRADYITGCNQYSVTAKSEKTGKQEHGHMWLDENRVRLNTRVDRVSLPSAIDQDQEDPVRKDNGGPQDTPSKT